MFVFFCLCCQPEPPSVLSFICLNTKPLLTAFQMNNSNTNCALTENKSPDCWYQTHRSKFVTLSRSWVVRVSGSVCRTCLDLLPPGLWHGCWWHIHVQVRQRNEAEQNGPLFWCSWFIFRVFKFVLFCLCARWKRCFILGVGRSVRVVSKQHGRFMNEGSFTNKIRISSLRL